MSMIANLLRVTTEELNDYLKDSSLLENRIYPETEEQEDTGIVDIDKSWEGILFLLTGQNLETLEHPLGRILFSGQMIDEEQDMGYGPAHYLTAEQVKTLYAEISSITTTELAQRYDAQKMIALEIYPNIWEESDIVDYLTGYFEIMRQLYAEATKNGEAVITFLN